MVSHMKTTLDIPDDLYRETKALAALSETNLRKIDYLGSGLVSELPQGLK